MLRNSKRGSHQAKKKKKSNQDQMINMTRILAQESMMEDVEKSSNA